MAIEPRVRPTPCSSTPDIMHGPRSSDGLFDRDRPKIRGSQRAFRILWRTFQPAGSKAWVDVLSRATASHSASSKLRLYDRQKCLRTSHAGDSMRWICCTAAVADGSGWYAFHSDLQHAWASGIRRTRVDVFGIGEQKTPESFRQACRRFTYTENLLPDAPANVESAGSKTKPLQPPSAATPIIRRVLDQMDTEDGWAPLGAVGNQLANLSSDFDPRNSASQAQRSGPLTNAFEIDASGRRAMRITQ